MKTRKVLAAATLAALPLVAGALQAGHAAGPRALYWAGVDPYWASLVDACYSMYVWGEMLAW